MPPIISKTAEPVAASWLVPGDLVELVNASDGVRSIHTVRAVVSEAWPLFFLAPAIAGDDTWIELHAVLPGDPAHRERTWVGPLGRIKLIRGAGSPSSFSSTAYCGVVPHAGDLALLDREAGVLDLVHPTWLLVARHLPPVEAHAGWVYLEGWRASPMGIPDPDAMLERFFVRVGGLVTRRAA
jgi:hypothetical protein